MTNCVPRPAQSHILCLLSGRKPKLETQDEAREEGPFEYQNIFPDFSAYVLWYLQSRYVTVFALEIDLEGFKSS